VFFTLFPWKLFYFQQLTFDEISKMEFPRRVCRIYPGSDKPPVMFVSSISDLIKAFKLPARDNKNIAIVQFTTEKSAVTMKNHLPSSVEAVRLPNNDQG